MKNRKHQIISFADKWLAKFSDSNLTGYDLADDPTFADESFALKFEMDCGHEFCEKYNVETLDKAIEILDSVDDIDYLASAIFSNWRYFNHWAGSCSEILDHRDWFIATLTRLKELAK